MAKFERGSARYVVTGKLAVKGEPRVAWTYPTLERALRATRDEFVPGSKVERVQRFTLVERRG